MKKFIPVYLNNRQVYRIEKKKPLITRVYEEIGKSFNIKKIYFVAGFKKDDAKIVIEVQR